MVKDLGRVLGTRWYTGQDMTGTPTDPTIFPDSDVDNARLEDLYLNTLNGNVYSCVLAGDPDTAKWVYTCNIAGPVAELVDNLRTDSATKALTARQGKVLNDKIYNSGIFANSVDFFLEDEAYIAEITLRNVEGTITFTTSEGTGTYDFIPVGIAERYTVSVGIGAEIDLEQEGAVIQNITFTEGIFDVKLLDDLGETLYQKELVAWNEINDALSQVKPSGVITADGQTKRIAAVYKNVTGTKEQVYPITHAKAVYFDTNNTVYDIVEKVRGFEGATTTFNQDGSITTTYSDRKIVTVFNNDGTITDTLKDLNDTALLIKTTTFNQDGSISEVVTTPV